MTKLGQRPAPNDAQHLGVAPFALGSARAKFPFDDAAAFHETLEGDRHHGHTQPVAPGHFRRRERSMRARVAQHQISGRIGNRLEQTLGDSMRKRSA